MNGVGGQNVVQELREQGCFQCSCSFLKRCLFQKDESSENVAKMHYLCFSPVLIEAQGILLVSQLQRKILLIVLSACSSLRP